MIYDYIIAGSGVAGNVCAYLLAQKGKSCLILEKSKEREEKICGGGIPYKALKMLSDMGMDMKTFLNQDVSIIEGDVCISNANEEATVYPQGQYALGSQRRIFDEFLLNQALIQGAEVRFGENVSHIKGFDSHYMVNGHVGKKVILAVGARGLSQTFTRGQSLGISAQIIGKGDLKPDKFYYWYYEGCDDRYFWIFPIGCDRWNVGIWFRRPENNMKSDFEKCWSSIFEKHFDENYVYVQKPVSEFLGNVDLRSTIDQDIYGIGDFAGVNNIQNGGGIYRSIKDIIKFCDALSD